MLRTFGTLQTVERRSKRLGVRFHHTCPRPVSFGQRLDQSLSWTTKPLGLRNISKSAIDPNFHYRGNPLCLIKKLSNLQQVMSSEEANAEATNLQDQLDALNAKITSQGATVRTLKKEGGGAEAIGEAVKALQGLKEEAAILTAKIHSDKPQFNRTAFDDLVLRKMFVIPSFEIHGGVKGLFDLGPPACGLKVRERNNHRRRWPSSELFSDFVFFL